MAVCWTAANTSFSLSFRLQLSAFLFRTAKRPFTVTLSNTSPIALAPAFLQKKKRRPHLSSPQAALLALTPSPTNTGTVVVRRMVQGVTIDGGAIVNQNPATHEVISRVPCTSVEELNDMVLRAKAAQSQWSQQTSPNERIQLLRQGLAALAKKSDDLVNLIVEEMGKPLQEAKEEVEGAVNKDDFLDILQASLEPKRHGSSVVVRQPLGTVVVLSPWNFPADEILLLVLPALGSGNTVIVKPSEVTPETGALVVNTLASVLPPGVLQLAQGDGKTGAHLVSHEAVDMIAMTGSSATGKRILEAAAPKLKRFVLELGGKDPMVVFEDADLDKAASDAVAYSLSNTGQVCCSIERIYVADSVYDGFSKRVADQAASYKVGSGNDPDVKVGPLVSDMQRDTVKTQVQDALEKGAELLYQSDIPHESPGSYYPVTVLANVNDDMQIYRDETFGPVVSLIRFNGSEAEAIRLANDTEYGLASCVYTRDKDKAKRVASAIDAGQVGINCYSLENMDIACPWVGHKSSGFGYHSGVEGFHQFSVPKTLVYEPE